MNLPEQQPAPTAKPPEAKPASAMIADLTAVKALVQKLGAAEVKALADLFD